MGCSQKKNSHSGLVNAVVTALNFGLNKRLDHPRLDRCLLIILSTDLFDHDPTKRMPNENYRSAQLLDITSALGSLEPDNM